MIKQDQRRVERSSRANAFEVGREEIRTVLHVTRRGISLHGHEPRTRKVPSQQTYAVIEFGNSLAEENPEIRWRHRIDRARAVTTDGVIARFGSNAQ